MRVRQVPVLLLFLAQLGACGGSSDPERSAATDPEPSPGTDSRGWANAEAGLFGHRRVDEERRAFSQGMVEGPDGSFGYAQGFEDAPSDTGVLVHEPLKTAPGVHLIVSGDRAEAHLAELDGTLLHRWESPLGELPGAPTASGPHQVPWRRVRLLEDGSLLAIHADVALLKLSRDSDVQWVHFQRVHHDLDCAGSGKDLSIVGLARVERVVPVVNDKEPIVDDLVIRLNGQGEKLQEFSLWDAFSASRWAPMLGQLTVTEGDVMHANSISILSETEASAFGDPAVKTGAALVCMRDLDLVGVVDMDTETLVWITQGPTTKPWRGAHDPTITADGELMIFDNLGGPLGNSRVLKMPLGGAAPSWSYAGTPPASFASLFCGTAQELVGGNVLVTESCRGRAFELQADTNAIVWEYVSDRLAGDEQEFIAALFEVERMPRPAWLSR